MNFFRAISIFFLLFLSIASFAQRRNRSNDSDKKDTISMNSIKIGVDTTLHATLPLVSVTGRAMSADERARFERLKRNVLKVMPYARFARDRYRKLQLDLAITPDNKTQRKLVKACDEQIKDMFNREVKKMTVTQGEILIKLIDRETGNSTYDLVKELKGGLNAFFYQSIARIVGHDLKDHYDPNLERDIESIILSSPYRYN
jgi:hypothetical protein